MSQVRILSSRLFKSSHFEKAFFYHSGFFIKTKQDSNRNERRPAGGRAHRDVRGSECRRLAGAHRKCVTRRRILSSRLFKSSHFEKAFFYHSGFFIKTKQDSNRNERRPAGGRAHRDVRGSECRRLSGAHRRCGTRRRILSSRLFKSSHFEKAFFLLQRIFYKDEAGFEAE